MDIKDRSLCQEVGSIKVVGSNCGNDLHIITHKTGHVAHQSVTAKSIVIFFSIFYGVIGRYYAPDMANLATYIAKRLSPPVLSHRANAEDHTILCSKVATKNTMVNP